MNKKLVALLLIFAIVCTAFASSNDSHISILLGAKVDNIGSKIDVRAASLNLSEISYFNKVEGKQSSPFFRFDAGAEMFFNNTDKPLIGLNGGAYAGYSVGIGPLAKVEIAGGVEFFESSVITYLLKKIAKEETYKITGYVAPAADLSVYLGLENISIRAGLRGSFRVSKTNGNGLEITPYVGISADLLQFLNIL